ncbi:LysE family translocator [Rheinheimera faecalis]|uniref:LysE family translocator n=1 Tax=Rheinheimera faecalis TaxID=2901141 RepID=UPI001E3F28EB|nr:LysE family translocator [Rheinheimera faecalis]
MLSVSGLALQSLMQWMPKLLTLEAAVIFTMEWNYLLALLTFSWVACITPGPNNMMILSSGLNFGVRASLPHLFGINLGFCLMVVLIGMGLGSVFTLYPMLHQLVKVVGLLYLLWLAWKIATTDPVSTSEGKVKPFGFWQAAAFQWVNAKAWVMITGAVATFTTVGGNIGLQIFLITAAFFLVGLPCTTSWLLGGHLMSKVLKNDRAYRLFNRLMGLLLAVSTWPVVYELFG